MRALVIYCWLVLGLANTGVCAAPRPALMRFEENKKQWDAAVRYRVAVPGGAVWLRNTGFTYTWVQAARSLASTAKPSGPLRPEAPALRRAHAVFVDFVGAKAVPELTAAQPAEAYSNYFMGNDPARWARHVRSFGEVRYVGLYPGIDLQVYGTAQGAFEYDVCVGAGANLARVQLRYRGANTLRLTPAGALRLTTSVGEVTEQRPQAYQPGADGRRRAVACRYRLAGNVVSFELPAGYDHAQPLVIDPVVQCSTYLGAPGAGGDIIVRTACHDSQGNLYVGSYVDGPLFPTTPGAYVVAPGTVGISKFNSTGTALLYSTHLGGTLPTPGSSARGTDVGHLMCDGTGNLFIYATTRDYDFPMLPNSYDRTLAFNVASPSSTNYDALIAKLSPAGDALLAATYLGGTGYEEEAQLFGALRVTASGEVYVSGCSYALTTSQRDFPTTAGAYNTAFASDTRAYICHFDPQLSTLRWSTLVGTSTSSGFNREVVSALQVAPAGQVYFAASTSASSFPATAGAASAVYSQGFVGCLAATGAQLLAATYLPASSLPPQNRPLNVAPLLLDLDPAGNVYVGGISNFTRTAPTPGAYVAPMALTTPYDQVFVTRLNAGLTQVLMTALLGGGDTGNAELLSLGVDQCGNTVMSVRTRLDLFPTSNALPTGILPATLHVSVLSSDFRQLLFGSYYGAPIGVPGNEAGLPAGATTDAQGRVYIAVATNNRNGTYPTLPGAYRTTFLPSALYYSDAVGVIIDPEFVTAPAPRAAFTVAPTSVCPGQPVQLTNTSTNAGPFRWNFGDGSALDSLTRSPRHTYAAVGTYRVRLRVRAVPGACTRPDTTSQLVRVQAALVRSLPTQVDLCPNTSVQLDAGNPGQTYRWSTGATTQTIPVTAAGRYAVQIGTGPCARTDSVQVLGRPALPRVLPVEAVLCPNAALTLDAGNPGGTYGWSTGATTQTISVNRPGIYFVLTRNGCGREDTVRVRAAAVPQVQRDSVACSGSVTLRVIDAAAGSTYRWSSGATSSELVVTVPGYYTVDVVMPNCTVRLGAAAAPTSLALAVPNVFTPNSEDNLNPTFRIPGLPANTDLSIFNRWGRLVYHSANYQHEWAAAGLPSGVYYYLLRNPAFCQSSQVKGWVEVVR